MDGLVNSLRGFGATRLLAMGVVGLGVMGLLLYLVNRLTAPDFALLYGDLTMEDSGRIVNRLDAMGIEYRLAASGGQILVPENVVLDARVKLA